MGIQRMYNTKVIVKRLSPDDDDADKEGYITHIAYLYCYLKDLSGMAASALGIYQPAALYTDVDQDIKPNDIIINERRDKTYIVREVSKHEMGLNQHLAATLERREAAAEE